MQPLHRLGADDPGSDHPGGLARLHDGRPRHLGPNVGPAFTAQHPECVIAAKAAGTSATHSGLRPPALPGPHPYQGSAHRLVSPGWHLRPGRTMYCWRPLETATNRSGPMACGPNVDHDEEGCSLSTTHGR